MDMPDIPEFLRRHSSEPKTARTYRTRAPKITMPKARKKTAWLPKTMTAEAWELLRQIEADKKHKQTARFAALRDRR